MKGSALELAEAEGFGPSPSHFQLSTSNSCSSGLYTADPLAPPHTDPRTAWIYTFSVSLAFGSWKCSSHSTVRYRLHLLLCQ